MTLAKALPDLPRHGQDKLFGLCTEPRKHMVTHPHTHARTQPCWRIREHAVLSENIYQGIPPSRVECIGAELGTIVTQSAAGGAAETDETGF